jgi:signal peptidase I
VRPCRRERDGPGYRGAIVSDEFEGSPQTRAEPSWADDLDGTAEIAVADEPTARDETAPDETGLDERAFDEGVAPGVDGDEAGGGEPAERGSSSARVFFDWLVVIAVALLVAFLVRGFVLAHFVVDGSSMEPTLHSGDRVFVNKLSYRLHDPHRGDVVVLHQRSGASERDLIKRVIGLPGEEVEMRSCQVLIDGAPLTEPYLAPETVNGNCGGDFEPVLVPPDTVFVMGDNRGGSQDSRQLGPISFHDLVGRAFVVFWPTSDWQWL